MTDERVLADTDTLMVFGPDHIFSEPEAEQGEIDAIREWLDREGTWNRRPPSNGQHKDPRGTGTVPRARRPAPGSTATHHAFMNQNIMPRSPIR